MPPALSDEESTQSSGEEQIPARAADDASLPASSPARANDEEDEDEDGDEDEYIVERILKHKTSKGKRLYQVKWQGYENPEDLTWETESNLAGAPDVLDAYLQSIGGSKSGQKRKGRSKSEVADDSSARGSSKRSKTASMETKPEWSPPAGSWEDDVDRVEAVEQRTNKHTGENAKFGYLCWKNNKKTQHPLSMIYRKCPQKMLAYYEEHLVFNEEPETNGDDPMDGFDDDY